MFFNRNNRQIILFIILIISISSYHIKEGHASSDIITNFTFGSNYYGRYSKDDNIFKTILNHNSNLWIWLGNAVYLDQPKFNYFQNSPKEVDSDFVKSLLKKVKNNEYYNKLNKKTPVVGTWGDEEYGVVNGDQENSYKEAFKQYYLDFLDVDPVDIRRHEQSLGIYSTYSFGKKDKTVRFILLDLKYYQNSYLKESNNDMLGEKQWTWLESIFKKYSETYTFICASNQILSNDRFIMKKWYSESRKRLFDLIGKYKKNGVILLTGGLGFSQILKTFCPLPNIGYNLYEFTSSGLSHTNKFSSFFNNFYHNDYLIEGTNYNGISFGQVKINWGSGNIKDSFVELETYDNNDNKVSSVKINYTDLMYKEDNNDFYNDINNMKEIKYMNIKDGKSCEREIYHRVRTPFMIVRYYLTHWKHLPEAILTIAVIFFSMEILFSKKYYYILISIGLCFIYYCLMFGIDLFRYYRFRKQILSDN